MELFLLLVITFYPIIIFFFIINGYKIIDACIWPILILKRAKDIWYE